MQKNNLFHQLYDKLYALKDYAKEVNDLMMIVEKLHPGPVYKILEIGCGTGNHTVELAKTKTKIVALDTDICMVDIAREKTKELKNVKIVFDPTEAIKEQEFDVALAMFNVITYIPDIKTLLSFFNTVSSCLKHNGVFIFDCWNGIAVIKDPPGLKVIEADDGNRKINCEIISSTDLFNQKVRLEYKLKVSEPGGYIVARDSYMLDQTLWTPQQIKFALEENKFQVLECCKNFQPGKQAEESDWKIMFICKKVNR